MIPAMLRVCTFSRLGALKVGDRYGSVARVWRRIHRHVGGGNHSHQRENLSVVASCNVPVT